VTKARLPSERAVDAAMRYRRGDVFLYREFRSDGAVLRFDHEPLVQRSTEGELAIRWPTYATDPATLRSVLNGILRGLELRHAYSYALRSLEPLMFCKLHGKWRFYHLTVDEWTPITYGELAQLALYAERRKTNLSDPAERMLARMSKFNPGVKP